MKQPVIQFTNFSYQYRVQAEPTLKNINLIIYEGEKILIVGPSGSGKSTYVNYVVEKLKYGEIVSTTTRAPRIGEVDGVDYHFVSREEFNSLDMIQRDEYAGNCYGTAQRDLDAAFKDCEYAFMVVTYEGAVDFKRIL